MRICASGKVPATKHSVVPCLLLVVALLAWCGQAGAEFREPFDHTLPQTLRVLPLSACNIFDYGASVTVSNTEDRPVRVWSLDGSQSWSNASPLVMVGLSPGHYFVETVGNVTNDRAAFCVLPPGYNGGLFGAEAVQSNNMAGVWRLQRIRPTFLRFGHTAGIYWRDNTNSFAVLDTVIATNRLITSANRWMLEWWGRPTWLTNDAEFVTHWTQSVFAVVSHIKTTATEFGDIQMWNEPRSFDMTLDSIPYATNNNVIAQHYVDYVLRPGYQAAKSANSNIVVWMETPTRPRFPVLIDTYPADWTNWFDAFTTHEYRHTDPVAPTNVLWQSSGFTYTNQPIYQMVTNYTAIAGGRQYGMVEGSINSWSGLGIPINTNSLEESRQPGTTNALTAFNRTVKAYVQYRAAGVEWVVFNVLYIAGTNSSHGFEWGPSVPYQSGRGPKHTTTALMLAAHRLNGFSPLSSQRLGDDGWLHVFTNRTTELRVALPFEDRAITNSIPGTPTLVTGLPYPLVGVVSNDPAFFTRPKRWDGLIEP